MNLAPPSLFVGGVDPRIVEWLRNWAPEPYSATWWIAVISLGFVVYIVVVAVLWYLFLESHDHRTKEEREFHQKEDDEDQARYLEGLKTGVEPMFSSAEKTMLKMLKEMVPDGQGPKMLYVNYPNLQKAYQVRPGGFILVMGPYEEVTTYFKNRRWERLPFVFQGRHIYRKPR